MGYPLFSYESFSIGKSPWLSPKILSPCWKSARLLDVLTSEDDAERPIRVGSTCSRKEGEGNIYIYINADMKHTCILRWYGWYHCNSILRKYTYVYIYICQSLSACIIGNDIHCCRTTSYKYHHKYGILWCYSIWRCPKKIGVPPFIIHF